MKKTQVQSRLCFTTARIVRLAIVIIVKFLFLCSFAHRIAIPELPSRVFNFFYELLYQSLMCFLTLAQMVFGITENLQYKVFFKKL